MTSAPPQVVGSAQPSDLAQKCDGGRPCTTSTTDRSTSECVYNDDEDPESAGACPLRSTDGYLSEQHLRGAGPIEIPKIISPHSSTELNLTPSTSGATSQILVSYERPSRLLPAHKTSSGQRTSLDLNPSISVVSSFLPPTIPPEPRIPLSFLREERLQVQFSETGATDQDLRSCVFE